MLETGVWLCRLLFGLLLEEPLQLLPQIFGLLCVYPKQLAEPPWLVQVLGHLLR